MMPLPELLPAVALIGLAIGSFLNVVIYRVPEGLSIVSPGSACPGCATPVATRDNIPVLSWLLLRGRCRGCGMRIAWRYPAVEALTAALSIGLAVRFGASWTLPAELMLVWGLVALAFVDAERMLLPKRIVWPTGGLLLAGLVVAAAAHGQWHRLGVAALTAAVCGAVFFAIHTAVPRGMGFGDVRLAPVIGLGLGWLGWEAAFVGFFLANLVGAAVGVALVAARRHRRGTPIPFGVFLAVGAYLGLLLGGSVHRL